MKTDKQKATLSTLASFPKGYFLENLAVRADNSILVTSIKTHELWWFPQQSRVNKWSRRYFLRSISPRSAWWNRNRMCSTCASVTDT
jgi:hypothetical protein